MKKYLLLLFSTVFVLPLASQSSLWTLKQCVDSALQNNLSTQQSANNVDLNEAALGQSKANRVPTLNGNVSQSFGSGRTLNPVTYQFTTANIWGNQFGLSSSVTLFNGLQTANKIKQNELNYERSHFDLEQVKNDITLSIVNAYLQVLFAKELVKVTENQIEVTTLQMTRIKELFDVGLKPETDLLQLKSQLATDKLSAVKAKGQLKTAKLSLQQLMNVTPDASFDIEYTTLPAESLIFTERVNDVYEKALSSQPAIKVGQLNTQSAAYGIKIAKGAGMPSLSLSGRLGSTYSSASKLTNVTYNNTLTNIGYLQSDPNQIVIGSQLNPVYSSSDYPFADQIKKNYNTSIALSLNIPILNNLQVRYNMQTQILLYKNAQLNEEQIKSKLRKDVEQNYIDAENAMESLTASKEQLNAVTALWQNAEAKYKSGLITTSDLLLEKNKYIIAQSDYLKAKYELVFRMKTLDYYMGIPIDL